MLIFFAFFSLSTSAATPISKNDKDVIFSIQQPQITSDNKYNLDNMPIKPALHLFSAKNHNAYIFGAQTQEGFKSNCALPIEYYRQKIKTFYQQPDSVLDLFFKHLSINWWDEALRSQTYIYFFDFGATESVGFHLYNYPRDGMHAILLNCQLSESTFIWQTLHHEFTHLILAKYNPPHWLNEGVAMLVESLIDSPIVKERLTLFSRENEIPPLFTDEFSFFGDSYALSYLFSRYLFEQFGHAETLVEMIQNSAKTISTDEDRYSKEYFFNLMQSAQQSLVHRNYSHGRYLNPQHFLTFFAIALVLNTPKEKLYSIPKWQGFASHPKTSVNSKTTLYPGQILRFHPRVIERHRFSENHDLSIVRVLKRNDETFLVYQGNEVYFNAEDNPEISNYEEFIIDELILVNNSPDDIIILEYR